MFVVVDAFGRYLTTGAIVEGVELSVPGTHGVMGVRVLDDGELVRKPAGAHPVDGWYGITISPSSLRPLTPAAAEMLQATVYCTPKCRQEAKRYRRQARKAVRA